MIALGSLLSVNSIGVVVALLVVTTTYWKWKYQYWKRRNVPYLEPRIPFGNMEEVIRGEKLLGIRLAEIYKEMKTKGWRHGGIYTFTRPIYIVLDLDYVRNVTTKDFKYFMDRNVFVNENEPLQAHLLNLSGTRWKNMRGKLTPTFSSGKVKAMFQVMAESENELQQKMYQEYTKNQPIDIKEILACFTTNVIGSCAFGLDCQALEDEDSPFRVFTRNIFVTTRLESFKRLLSVTFPLVAKLINLKFTLKENADFVMKMVQDTIDYRKNNNYTRKDFMQLLINLKDADGDGHNRESLSMDELASQVLAFFAAGYETSSTLMTFALYELARHEDIQEKLRREINEVLEQHNGQMTYDAIQDMKYLGQVIDESLRMHSPAAQLSRTCIKDYKLPDQDVIIEKGTTVIIPVMGIHYDEEYYPEPEKFDPERFTEENKKSRPNYTFMPFGEGPRNCIGMRFGLVQSKMGVVSLLKDYKLTVNKKTREPLYYSPDHLFLSAEGEIWLDAEKI